VRRTRFLARALLGQVLMRSIDGMIAPAELWNEAYLQMICLSRV